MPAAYDLNRSNEQRRLEPTLAERHTALARWRHSLFTVARCTPLATSGPTLTTAVKCSRLTCARAFYSAATDERFDRDRSLATIYADINKLHLTSEQRAKFDVEKTDSLLSVSRGGGRVLANRVEAYSYNGGS